jgi:hypothetical protein
MSTTAPAATILGWEDDPGQPDAPNTPISRPVPNVGSKPFPCKIAGSAPQPGGQPGSAEFRYWAAAEALRRAADFWGAVIGEGQAWQAAIGEQLTVQLDEGEDLNAYYSREKKGLNFFHEEVAGQMIYSGESPDIVCHEFGHAILDALQPSLFEGASHEAPALHEAFGDMSAMLSALQLPQVRKAVLKETEGWTDHTSRLSRLAEQLGWAIRHGRPDGVDPDCLRNACNSFFYQDPMGLPPGEVASNLSSEPHSFSRVFSAAFLSLLTGMFLITESKQHGDPDMTLEQVSHDAGKLLVEAARHTPVCVPYYSQFAAHMVAADRALFGGNYARALGYGFVSHGILSLSDITSSPSPAVAAAAVGGGPDSGDGASGGGDGAAAATAGLGRIALSGEAYGLAGNLLVHASDQPLRFNVRSAAPDFGAASVPTHEDAAAGYVEDLFRRGQVAVDPEVSTGREVIGRRAHPTHEVRRENDDLVLRRLHFNCGFACH